MPTWNRKLRIKHLLSDSNEPEIARETGTKIAQIIRASSWHAADVADAGDELDSEVDQVAEEFTCVDTVDELNAVLNDLYDLANADRVWIH